MHAAREPAAGRSLHEDRRLDGRGLSPPRLRAVPKNGRVGAFSENWSLRLPTRRDRKAPRRNLFQLIPDRLDRSLRAGDVAVAARRAGNADAADGLVADLD